MTRFPLICKIPSPGFAGLLLFLVAIAGGPGWLSAQITATGDYSPAYDGSDPWDMGAFATIGDIAFGSLRVENGSDLISGVATLGDNAGSEGVVTISGAGSVWTSETVTAGASGSGTVNILDGGELDNTSWVNIGSFAGGTGTVNVSGAGSIWTNQLSVSVGRQGTGNLNITDGGQVSVGRDLLIAESNNSSGAVVVNGAGATLTVAEDIDVKADFNSLAGSLSVENGGIVTASTATVRFDGIVDVDGVNSSLNVENYNGQGGSALNISNGGTVNVSEMMVSIGDNSMAGGTLNTLDLLANFDEWQGQGTINALGVVGDFDLVFDASHGLQQQIVFNSLPNQNIVLNLDVSSGTGVLGAGFFKSGTLTIADGVSVKSTSGQIGYGGANAGTATVTGADSTWTVEGGIVLREGSLNIENGGRVLIGTLLFVGPDEGSTVNLTDGVLEFTGNDGQILISGDFFGSGVSTFNLSGGVLRNASRISITNNGEFLHDGGTLAPGNSPGITAIEGDYVFASGNLEIELDGTAVAGTDYDQLQVTGTVNLIGPDLLTDSQLDLILGFEAELGDMFTILANDDLDPVTGQFANGSLATASFNGLVYGFAIDYAGGSGNDITLTVSSIAPVPEPGGLLVVALTLPLLLRRRDRNRRPADAIG